MRSSSGPSKLFVGDLGDNRKTDLSRLFSKYGEILTIYLDDNKHFAFIEFTSSSDAQRALRHTNNKTLNGSKLRVEYAKSEKTNRRPPSRERSPASALYNHLQVTANRLPPMQSSRHNYYPPYSSAMMASSSISRGRSLTPPSFRQNARLSSMNHLRTQDFYPPYYPHPPAIYPDGPYYRAYEDPYLVQRLPPPAFFPPTSPPSSSSRAYRHMYASSDHDRYPPVVSQRRSRRSRSRSRSRRRNSPSRRRRSSRERKRKRRTSSSSSPPKQEQHQQRERGPQTPPPSNQTKKRSRSGSDPVVSASEQKSSSNSSSEDEANEDKQSTSRRSQENDSNRKHSKRKPRE